MGSVLLECEIPIHLRLMQPCMKDIMAGYKGRETETGLGEPD